jgi:mycoredoxin
MTEPQPDQLLLYGRPGCPMVPPVRALLDEAGVEYTYLDVRKDSEAAVRLRQLTGGFESVPTVVLPGGRVLVEPGVMALRRALAEMGLGDNPGAAGTLKAGLSNPVYPILLLIALVLAIAVAVSG